MEIKDHIIKYKRSYPDLKLYCIGDIHAGTIHCLEREVEEKIKEIRDDENALWVGMGDYAEFITPRDNRFDPHQRSIAEWVETDDIAKTQTDWVIKLFEPIKDKCLGLLYGNHEEAIRKHNHDNVQKWICDGLGVDNLGFSCHLRLYFHRKNSNERHLVTGSITHGTSGAITDGAKLTALRRFMENSDADFYAYAHVHDYISKSKPILVTKGAYDEGKIKSREIIGATTASWFRTYTRGIVASYGEQKLYPATVLGCAKFIINPAEHEIDVMRSK